MRSMSDTATPYANNPMYCPKCRHNIFDCICHYENDFLENKFDREQIKLIPKRISSYIHNAKPSTIPIRKNLHSLSGMRGVKLLKKMDKK